MRLFQNIGVYPAYRDHLVRKVLAGQRSFSEMRSAVIDDRYAGVHILEPILASDASAFFTCSDVEPLQRSWAREHGLPASATAADILLAQIEAHRADVFYTNDPIGHGPDFPRRLPGCVRRSVVWRAAPGRVDLSGYDLIVSNFPSIREALRLEGLNTGELYPGHDPALEAPEGTVRDLDVLFFGGFSRHHRRRAAILEEVASLSERFHVRFHFDPSRYTRLAETPFGLFPPLSAVRRPRAIRRVAEPALWGREVYGALRRARVVLNAAVDMAGEDRGNMRCFEALGAGALLVSDRGRYPPGMVDGETFLAYGSPAEAVRVIVDALTTGVAVDVAQRGVRMVRERYSKAVQFRQFESLLS